MADAAASVRADAGADMRIQNSRGIAAVRRIRSLRFLASFAQSLEAAREIEAAVHSISDCEEHYSAKIQQLAYNLRANPALRDVGTSIVTMSDSEMARGTIIEDIERESRAQRDRFESVLQEKYQKVQDIAHRATLRCRRCGSGDVSCEQKQTRGADEAMTVFCTCQKCQNRWTMR